MQLLNTYRLPSQDRTVRFIYEQIGYAKNLNLFDRSSIVKFSPSKVTSEEYWVRINYAKRITKSISIEVLNEITQSKTKT